MEEKNTTLITFTDEERSKLRGGDHGASGLTPPYAFSNTSKEELIKEGEEFIGAYNEMAKCVSEWRKLIEELKQ